MRQTVSTRTIRIRRVRRTEAHAPGPTVPCASCGRDVPGVTPVEAIVLLQGRAESFSDLLDSGAVHAIPTAAGATWICRDSIFRRTS